MKKIILLFACININILTQAIPLTLNNADFEAGKKIPSLKSENAEDDNPAEGWIVLHEHKKNSFYVVNIREKGSGSGSISLNLKALGFNNIIQHSIIPSEATADTYGTFNVTMDLGTRNNTGVPLSLNVEIWDLAANKALATQTYEFPLESDGLIERKTFTLSYDNTAPYLKNHPIALRFVTNSEGATFKTTHWIDNVTMDAVSEKPKNMPPKKVSNTPKKTKHPAGLLAFFTGIFLLFKKKKTTS
jgi:hypothetical protein